MKKVDKERGTVKFSENEMDVDLPTADQTRFKAKIPLFGPIVPEESSFAVKGTKVEEAAGLLVPTVTPAATGRHLR